MLNKQNKIFKNVHKFGISTGLMVSFAFATLPLDAHALTIQPHITDIVAQAGETHELTVQLRNDTDFVEVVTLRAHAFIAGEQEGVPYFVDDQPHTRWFHIPQGDQLLQSQQTKTINIPLAIPLDAEPGGYYAAVFARAQPQDASNTVSYANEVGSLVFITVKGELNRDVSLADVQGIAHLWGATRFEVNYTLHNNGTIHEIPRGTVSIRNIFSGEQEVMPLNVEELRLLPGSQRTLMHSWQPERAWHSPFNPFRFGIYELSIVVDGIEQITRMRIFVWSPAAPVLLIILAGALNSIRKRKRS